MIFAFLLYFFTLLVESPVQTAPGQSDVGSPARQFSIPQVEKMPNLPRPFEIKDWLDVTIKQDQFLFDFDAKGEHLPLIWWDDSRVNFPQRGFGFPSYVGLTRQQERGSNHEALTGLGAVLSASLVGIDKSNQNGHDFVSMCKQYFSRANGENIVLNNVSKRSGSSFWYDLYPAIVFCMLVDLYPELEDLATLMKLAAERWAAATLVLSEGRSLPNYDFTGFSMHTMQPVDNGRWKEADAAAGVAWLEYVAWKKWKDEKFLETASLCMEFLDRRPKEEGPYYEILMPFGAYLAARINAELGRGYDLEKMINWCFDGENSSRRGWGVITERWAEYDCFGLVGQQRTGYAFAMNTFAQVGAMLPIVRYDPRYARTIGKWILNAVNASRLFYADEHPPERQTSAWWDGDPEHVISYEGCRRDLVGGKFNFFHGKLSDQGPYGVGDRIKNGQSTTDFALYGSAYVGFFGGTVKTTEVEGILQLDCLKTDFFRDDAFPTYLLYNPHEGPKETSIDVGPIATNVYDLVSKTFLRKSATRRVSIPIPPDSAVVVVLVPADKSLVVHNENMVIDGTVVDFAP